MNNRLQKTSPETPVIEFRHVFMSFGDVLTLSDVSFELKRGQMIVITGNSGSGKSVLLRLAVGLFTPDEGEILVDGQHIENLGERELLHLRSHSIGIVFQEESIFTALSVYDNTAYLLEEQGRQEEEADRAVREILHFVGLENDVDKLPEELSVGMKRRLEFARALAGWRPIMLFDEATSGLDPINARRIMDLVIHARDIKRISSLYVTKELHEIPYLATHRAIKDESGHTAVRRSSRLAAQDLKVMLLEKGRIAFFGSPTEFEMSDLPAVLQMTHPASGSPVSSSYVADPWDEKRNAGHILMG